MPSKYLEFGSAHLHVPSEMIGFDKSGGEHLYHTLTKKHHLAIHNGKSAVSLDTRAGHRAVRAVKGKLLTLTKKIKQTKATGLKHKSKLHEVKAAEADVKVAIIDAKTKRGRRPLTVEQKQAKLAAKREASAHKKAGKAAEKAAKAATKAAAKAALPKKRRGRKPKQV